jgi:hypothetical protein
MRLERYNFETDKTKMLFEFVSEGPKGRILKRVQYSLTENSDWVYNLAFGDKKLGEDDIDDIIITDNKDSEKVLATVAATVLVFTDTYKNVAVFAIGSTKARTRLYQIGIAKNLEDLQLYFHVFGYYKGKWVEFQKNVPYEAFHVIRK